MPKLSFADLPAATKFSTALSFFLGWVVFAEFVIDRHGWSAYLPYYKVGNLCPYDAAVILLLIVWWVSKERAAAMPATARGEAEAARKSAADCC